MLCKTLQSPCMTLGFYKLNYKWIKQTQNFCPKVQQDQENCKLSTENVKHSYKSDLFFFVWAIIELINKAQINLMSDRLHVVDLTSQWAGSFIVALANFCDVELLQMDIQRPAPFS